MKKNKMMRLASVLLVAVLLSTCAISGTFAKYTTTTSATDEARVAYWGFNHAASQTFDLFDGNYTNVDNQDDANVVAPGTEKTSTLTFVYTDNAAKSITAPEVKYNFNITLTPTSTTSYAALDANKNFVWTLQLPGQSTATTYQTVAELKTAIESMNGDYEPGTLPKNDAGAQMDAGDNTITIGWKWTFSVDNTGDVADTAMGNAASLDHVKFDITITATQLD